MAAACVDYFSGGRFILGLGSSHRVQVGPEHGLPFGQPIPRLRECVDIVRQLLQNGEVAYRGEVFDIQGFDLQFEPLRREIPIYVAAVFPRMLGICGEIAQGTLLTWCTLDHARAAAKHVAEGARRQGRDPSEVEVATLISCAVGEEAEAATQQMRAVTANYAARFPRYRRLMVEAGYADEIEAVRRAWRQGNRQEALELVPSGLIQEMALVGEVEECRNRLQEYRDAGITLPIISPRIAGPGAKQQAMSIIRACAPS
jgi:alkanesulfonate monooxygenase SsuD/methylene tetrahydromethanopterin reductase-like flavin-dependent oxidoreductase (luciferase family)